MYSGHIPVEREVGNVLVTLGLSSLPLKTEGMWWREIPVCSNFLISIWWKGQVLLLFPRFSPVSLANMPDFLGIVIPCSHTLKGKEVFLYLE